MVSHCTERVKQMPVMESQYIVCIISSKVKICKIKIFKLGKQSTWLGNYRYLKI